MRRPVAWCGEGDRAGPAPAPAAYHRSTESVTCVGGATADVAAFQRGDVGFEPSQASTGSRGVIELVLSHVAERSVLEGAGARALVPFEVAGRRRFASCSGVAWFRADHLAVVNLNGGHLRVYRFHPDGAEGAGARLELLHETSEGIARPEDVTVSPDGSLLAITHSSSDDHGVSIHHLGARTFAFESGLMLRRGRAFHGLNLSPDSRHLAFTQIGDPGRVEVVSTTAPEFPRTCLIESREGPLKPKSVAFSRDGRYAAIVKSLNVERRAGAIASSGQLAVHAYAAERGTIAAQPMALLATSDASLGNAEMCTFLPTAHGTPYRLLVANQGADAVSRFEFDAPRRILSFTGTFAEGLSFPHGIDASEDGRHVAVTNYGDDSLRIFRVV